MSACSPSNEASKNLGTDSRLWIRRFPVIILLLALIGCTSSGTPAPLHRVPSDKVDLLFSGNNLDLSKYDQVLVDPLSIWYSTPNNEEWTPDPKVLERMRGHFWDALVHELEERGGYEIVRDPGPRVLHVHAEIVDLKICVSCTAPVPDSRLQRYRFRLVPGQITLVAELRDSQTGEVLLRAADLERPHEEALDSWEEVRVEFHRWARILRERLDDSHGVKAQIKND
ncbi:MAG: DUF3313 family protein [Pseudomonadota bacterium]